MRPRKATNGRVPGVKFKLDKGNEPEDLKKEKARILKELKEKEEKKQDWYDNEMEKNLKNTK